MSPKTAFAKTLAALNSNADIDRDELRKWIEAADLKTLGVLYVLTNKAWSRITPKLTMKEVCDLIRRYYLTCITKNPRSSDYLLTRYEAAWTMVAWFRHLVSMLPETEDELKTTVDAVTSLYTHTPYDEGKYVQSLKRRNSPLIKRLNLSKETKPESLTQSSWSSVGDCITQSTQKLCRKNVEKIKEHNS